MQGAQESTSDVGDLVRTMKVNYFLDACTSQVTALSLRQKCLVQKDYGSEETFLFDRNVLSENLFCLNKILDLKKMCVQKNLGIEKNLGTKKIFV